jgi:hypothetical protein
MVALTLQYRIDLDTMLECHARMLRLVAMALLLSASDPWSAAAHSCRCIYQGGMIKQGETACLKTANGYQLARCEMVLNNSSWKFLDKPCDRLQSQSTSIPPKNG